MRRLHVLRKNLLPGPFVPWPYEPCSLRMPSILNFLLNFLRKLRLTRGVSIHYFIKRWALFLAFLRRRLGVNHLWHDRKRGTPHKPSQEERSPSGTGARLELGEYVVAASQIPASASHPNLPDVVVTTGQPQTTSSSRASPPASLTVEPHRDHAHPTALTVIHSNRSVANLSTHSRASDRLSIIQTHSRESLHAPGGQTTRFPRGPHRQFGRGPSPSPSRERPSGSPSPTNRVYPLPHLEIDTTNLRPQTHVDGRHSPVTPSSVASHAHAPLSPPSLHGHHRRRSSTSVVVGIVTPSTDSLPLSPLTNQPPLTDEPYAIGPLIDPSSPIADAPDARERSSQHSPTTSSPTSNFDLPLGRVLQLINSEQVPRYTKEVPVQVDYIIATIKPLSLFSGPAKEHTMRFHL
jgi:hypothetical protein